LVGFSIGSQQAKISWTAPTTNGGSTISSYTITSNPAVYTTTVAGSIVTVTTGAVLTNGSPYIFTVLATNSVGLSNSAVSGSTTPYGLAGQPTNLAGTASNGQVALSWTAPSGNGATINNYRIVQSGYASNTYNVGSGTTSYNVTSLTNGQNYTFTVAATNDNSNYGTASGSITTTIGTVPSAPVITGTQAVLSATLNWASAPANNGLAIDQYGYSIDNGGTWTSFGDVNSRSVTITGISGNTTAYFVVRAHNSLGWGPASNMIQYNYPGPPSITSTGFAIDYYNGYQVGLMQNINPSTWINTIIFVSAKIRFRSNGTFYTYTDAFEINRAYNVLFVRINTPGWDFNNDSGDRFYIEYVLSNNYGATQTYSFQFP
jgi:hypothetical protein